MRNVLFTFCCSFLFFFFGLAQERINLTCEINLVQPSNEITRTKFNESESIFDLDRFCKSSWVREYISVEIKTINNGGLKNHFMENDFLNPKEKEIINSADAGEEVIVNVKYIPENNLNDNEEKELKIKFTIIPEKEAEFPQGEKALGELIRGNIMNKIPYSVFKEYQLIAAKFTVNEKGEIINVQILESSGNKEIDDSIINAISKMSNWRPAEYNNGIKAKQKFVLTIGDHRSCTVNTLDIRDF